MAKPSPPPLSPAVKEVFDQFVQNLSDGKILGASAAAFLAKSLHEQRLDPESLREAILRPEGTAQ